MANKANSTYSFPALDVAETATANKTVGDVTAVANGGIKLWLTTTASGDQGTVRVFGPASLTIATGVALNPPELVYWNAASGTLTKTNTDTPVGFAIADKAAAAGATQAVVMISPFES